MRLVQSLACLLILVACDSAGPAFRGAEPVKAEIDGSRFTLRFRGDMVEAVRTSPEWNPRFETVAEKAARAAEAQRPGCVTDWVDGDPAMLLLGLKCNGRPAPSRPRRKDLLLCDPIGYDGSAESLECRQL